MRPVSPQGRAAVGRKPLLARPTDAAKAAPTAEGRRLGVPDEGQTVEVTIAVRPPATAEIVTAPRPKAPLTGLEAAAAP